MISLLQQKHCNLYASIKVSYAQNYDTDTAGIAGDLEAMKQTLLVIIANK